MKKFKLRQRVSELEARVEELESLYPPAEVTVRVHSLNGKVLTKTYPFRGYYENHTFSFLALDHPSLTVEEITWELHDGISEVQFGSWGDLARGYYIDRAGSLTLDSARWVPSCSY